ncbi:methylase of polypeptide subunit release factors [Brevundimonas alba]|uniref:Methylase of polypeptide subunit release factors n=1 Tax=Brevundimonas alba TaxID=74314 RepID=A0A7X5YLT8_9CAUL|nr:methyltransferase [Brevundimonas alba]NJC41019.1 methylase of polypeptide subunit release factors [Brevundimonas alba]
MDAIATDGLTVSDQALLDLLRHLEQAGYAFVTPTPATHATVGLRRAASEADALRDVFGWSRPFSRDLLEPGLMQLAETAGVVRHAPEGLRLAIRVSTVDGRLHLHSAPTRDEDAVFLGPDSYRYVRFIRQALGGSPNLRTALDIGVGAGVGALTLAALSPSACVVASDVNHRALRLTRLNSLHGGLPLDLVHCSGLPERPDGFDVIAANPPYIAGKGKRTYRDGGDQLGAALALDWVREGVRRLTPGGRFLLYTGSAIVAGHDAVREALQVIADEGGLHLTYEEIDPDVFGGTLRQEAYREVERIAAVGAVLTAP